MASLELVQQVYNIYDGLIRYRFNLFDSLTKSFACLKEISFEGAKLSFKLERNDWGRSDIERIYEA